MNQPSSNRKDWLQRIDGVPFHRNADRLAEDLKREFVGDEQVEGELPADHLALAQRVANCDAVLNRCLEDVEVPAGLADRLKDRLSSAKHDALLDVDEHDGFESSVRTIDRSARNMSPSSPHQRRPAWLGWVALSLLVCFVASSATIAFVVMRQPPAVVSRDHLAHQSMEWKLSVDQQEWTVGLPPQSGTYPVSQDVLTQPRGWMTISTNYDPQTVVYDLTPPGQKQVLQFTVRTSRQFNLDPVLPAEPTYETGSFCIGASYFEGVLYVVFVEGDVRRYREVIWEVGPAG